MVIPCHILEYLDKLRYLELRVSLGRLNPEQAELLVNIKECLHHEVLGLPSEALSELLDLDKALGSLVEHLDVLTR